MRPLWERAKLDCGCAWWLRDVGWTWVQYCARHHREATSGRKEIA